MSLKFSLSELALLLNDDKIQFRNDMSAKYEEMRKTSKAIGVTMTKPKFDDNTFKNFLRTATPDELKEFKSIQYLNDKVFRTSNSTFIQAVNDYEVYDNNIFKIEYVERFQELKSYWLHNPHTPCYTFTMEPTQQQIDKINHKINFIKPMKHQFMNTHTNEKYQYLVKQLDKLFYNIGECNEDTTLYVKKWCSNILHGNTNSTMLFLFSHTQGVGKSTLSEIMSTILGERAKRINVETITKYNGALKGTTFAFHDEMPEKSDSCYSEYCTKIKEAIGAPSLIYRDIYGKAIELPNVTNFITTGNYHFSIKEQRGRRIINLHVKYDPEIDFNLIRGKAFQSEELRQVIFDYIYSVDCSTFNHKAQQDNAPVTNLSKNLNEDLCSQDEFIIYTLLNCHNKKEMLKGKMYEMYCEKFTNIKARQGKINFYSYCEEVFNKRSIGQRREVFIIDIDKASIFYNKKKIDIVNLLNIRKLEQEEVDNDDNDDKEVKPKDIEYYKKLNDEKDDIIEQLKKQLAEKNIDKNDTEKDRIIAQQTKSISELRNQIDFLLIKRQEHPLDKVIEEKDNIISENLNVIGELTQKLAMLSVQNSIKECIDKKECIDNKEENIDKKDNDDKKECDDIKKTNKKDKPKKKLVVKTNANQFLSGVNKNSKTFDGESAQKFFEDDL